MDASQWPQGIGLVKPMEDSSRPINSNNLISTGERKPRPQKEQALNCPRCNSTNTKFCYYNNYSLTQPRYFCKTCRRYWTEGGSLRNVPVGGGSRKNKRSSTNSSSSSSPKNKLISLENPNFPNSASQNPKIHEAQDLNLAYPPTSGFVELSYNNGNKNPSSSSNAPSHHLSAMELLKSTGIGSRGMNCFAAAPMAVGADHHHHGGSIYSAGFAMPEFKPSLNFSLDGFESGYGGLQGGVQESGGSRLQFFPFEDLKSVANTSEFDQSRGQAEPTGGYWNGMLGGGSW